MSKHVMLGALLEVAMSKKCTPLWRDTHVEVNYQLEPDKAVAEVSKIGNPLGEVRCCESWMADQSH